MVGGGGTDAAAAPPSCENLLREGAPGRGCHAQLLYVRLGDGVFRNKTVSVTEREVIHGILKAKNPNEHCLCYVRHINNIALNQTKTASRFVDIQHNHVSLGLHFFCVAHMEWNRM